MNKLLAALCAGVFTLGSAIAIAQPAKTDSMKSSTATTSTMSKDDMAKYKDCMKKDASGKDAMDKECKDKMDKSGSMSKSSDSMAKGMDKAAAPTGAASKDAPKGK